MSEEQSKKPTPLVEQDLISALSFGPDWAREAPDDPKRYQNHTGDRGGSGRSSYGGGSRSRGRMDRGGDSKDRRPRPDARRREEGSERRTRPASRDRFAGSAELPMAPPPGAPVTAAAPRREGGAPPPRRDSAPAGGYDRPRGGQQHGGGRPRRDFNDTPRAPLQVRFLPEQNQLVGLIRQVTTAKRAYPLIDLARLLLGKEGCCFVKLQVEDGAEDTCIYQCKTCQTISLSEDELVSHVVSSHFEDSFEMEEREGEAATGAFVCVARCGLSGRLLGPPNHHSYNDTVKQIHTSLYPNMSVEDYKRRIEMSHEADDVERWRTESSAVRVYRRKEEADAEWLSWGEAYTMMRDAVAPASVQRMRRVSLPEATAKSVTDASIKRAIREEWRREEHFPIQLSFALRAAFRHKHMHIFKAGDGKGVNFVTTIEPKAIAADHTVPAIRDMLTFVEANPGCAREQMLEALHEGCTPDSPEAGEMLKTLHWLVEKGHLVEFYNGTFKVPMAPPVAGDRPQK
jgi:hypothetical protein